MTIRWIVDPTKMQHNNCKFYVTDLNAADWIRTPLKLFSFGWKIVLLTNKPSFLSFIQTKTNGKQYLVYPLDSKICVPLLQQTALIIRILIKIPSEMFNQQSALQHILYLFTCMICFFSSKTHTEWILIFFQPSNFTTIHNLFPLRVRLLLFLSVWSTFGWKVALLVTSRKSMVLMCLSTFICASAFAMQTCERQRRKKWSGEIWSKMKRKSNRLDKTSLNMNKLKYENQTSASTQNERNSRRAKESGTENGKQKFKRLTEDALKNIQNHQTLTHNIYVLDVHFSHLLYLSKYICNWVCLCIHGCSCLFVCLCVFVSNVHVW